MTVPSKFLDNIVLECGGFGRYQIMLLVIVFLFGKLSSTWTMMVMSVAGAVPNWWCGNNGNHTLSNQTDLFMKCYIHNETQCTTFHYDDSMRTIVSEWNLVCNKAWITSTIITTQMVGNLISSLISGHVSDLFGRKPMLYISTLSLTLFNFIAYFSVSWQMFAAVRFVLGFASSSYLAVYSTLLIEFMPQKQRPLVAALPSWTIWAALLGGVAWLIPDWANLNITTAALTFPFLFTWWIVPESFRWLVSKRKIEKAEAVIIKMAKINKRPVPDISQIKYLTDCKHKPSYYTIRDLFSGWKIAKTTILLSVMWISTAYTYYSIAFGIQKLSGSIYLNMFLLNAVELPGNLFTYYLNNKIGRKWTCVLFYAVAGIAAFGVAIFEVTDMDPGTKGSLINGFALTAQIGNSAGWCSLATFTSESYPTVIRNIGYGFQSTAGLIGGVIAPQIVYLSFLVPGLMYFLSGGVMVLSAICAGLSEETLDKPLNDTMGDNEDD